MLGTELDDFLEELARRRLARRHVGVVDQHHLDAVETGTFDGLEVGIEVGLLVERIGKHLTARKAYGGRIGGIARVGDQHLVARIEERHADVHDTLLRTDEGQNLGVVVELHAVPLLVPVGKSLAQNGFALVRHVFVYVGTLSLLGQTVDDRLMGRQVGAAHCEFDNLAAGGCLDVGNFAQTTRKIVLSNPVQTV